MGRNAVSGMEEYRVSNLIYDANDAEDASDVRVTIVTLARHDRKEAEGPTKRA